MLVLLTVFSLMGCSGCASYQGDATEGWVVDATTKQPLEGVVVVVQWELYGGLHPSVKGRLLIQESVTDRNGRYAFPAWGPLRPKEYELDVGSPYLAFFKRGYVALELRNDWRPDRPLPKVVNSRWNGKTVELQSYKGDLKDYDFSGGLYSIRYLFGFSEEACAWELMPRMTAEMLMLGQICQEQRVSCATPSKERLRGAYQKECKDPDAILEGYLRD